MPIQVDDAAMRAPCPVPSCPACEPNTGSVHPNLPAKQARVERGRHCYTIKRFRARALNLCHRCHEFTEKSSKIVPLGAP
jgi:hypothetical protein